MSAARFERMAELFRRAAAMDTVRRGSFLDAECGADEALRRQVERLLAADASAETLVATPPPPPAPGTPPAPPPRIPDRVGRYRVVRLVAEGGMGRVYLAEQEQPRRVVALKVVKTQSLSRAALRRFEYESQILAHLNHPNVAKVFEAGTHDTGEGPVPYFAMEFVTGARPLTEYADKETLDLASRLHLFARVCDAVHHGHQKGIIHRDLKPGNILVDEAGHPKVIDFGVARCTESDIAVTTLRTDAGQLVGTVQYMSPEQCAPERGDVDTRSDVYALGVILYEMLCGRVPYDVSGRTLVDALRTVVEHVPPRPTAVRGAVGRDVETILLKTLEKRADDRYQSAGDLAADVRRYLAGRPIEARRRSAWYVARKFVGRHRVAVGVAAVLTLMIGAAAYALVQTRLESRRVEGEKRLVSEIAVALLGDSDQIRDPFNQSPPDRAVLAWAEQFVASGAGVAQEADLRTALGLGYIRLGRYEDAETHLRAALAQCMLQPARAATLAAAHHNLARALFWRCDYDGAERHFEEAIARRRLLYGDAHEDLADSLDSLGGTRRCQGRLDEAVRLRRDALAMRTRLRDEGVPGMEKWVVASGNNLAACLRDQGHLIEAKTLFRDAVEQLQRLGGSELFVARGKRSIATCAIVLGQYDEAERLLDEALAHARKSVGAEHPGMAVQDRVRAWLEYERGDHATAEALCRRALDARRISPLNVAAAKTLLARVLIDGGTDLDEAGILLNDAERLRSRFLDPAHADLAEILAVRALLEAARGDGEEAERLARAALAIQRSALPDHPATGDTASLLGDLLRERGQTDEARTHYDEAIAVYGRSLATDHARLREARVRRDGSYGETAR